MEKFRLDDLCKKLIGKTLISLEFGSKPSEEEAEENGERYLPKNAVIEDAMVSITEGDRDPCVRLILGEDLEIEAYSNEIITIK